MDSAARESRASSWSRRRSVSQRVVPLDAGVVRHLVVADEVGVDHRPSGAHVPDDGRDDDVAGEHRGERPEERVHTAAVDARAYVAAPLDCRLVHLAHRLGDDAEQGAHRGVRLGEVGVVPGPDAAPLATGARHREDRVLGVAGEDVAAAGAVGVQQARGRSRAASRAPRRAAAGWTPTAGRCPSRTSGRPACRRWSPSGSPPARRRSGRTSPSSTGRADGSRMSATRRSSARCRREPLAAAPGGRARRSARRPLRVDDPGPRAAHACSGGAGDAGRRRRRRGPAPR